MIVDTASPTGEAWCPICHADVAEEGDFCGPECFQHFHWTIFDSSDMIEMTYKPLEEQPWAAPIDNIDSKYL